MANDAFMSILETFEKTMDIPQVNIESDTSNFLSDIYTTKLSFENDTLSFENDELPEEVMEEEVAPVVPKKTGRKISDAEARKTYEWLEYVERTTTSKQVRKMCRNTREAVEMRSISYETLYKNLEIIKKEYNKIMQ